MKLRFSIGAAILAVTFVSCDSGGSSEPNLGNKAVARINDTAMQVYFIKIQSAAQKFRAVRGVDPADVSELVSEGLLDRPSATDPWGNPWVLDTSSGQLTVISYGADGQPGGSEEARDRQSR